MKVAVIGSRNLWMNIAPYLPENISLIITGGAQGIDSIAEAYADKNKIPKLIIRPDYDAHGKSAPLLRNRCIVDAADIVLAFWDGSSSGTAYVVKYAKKTGKPIKIIRKTGYNTVISEDYI